MPASCIWAGFASRRIVGFFVPLGSKPELQFRYSACSQHSSNALNEKLFARSMDLVWIFKAPRTAVRKRPKIDIFLIDFVGIEFGFCNFHKNQLNLLVFRAARSCSGFLDFSKRRDRDAPESNLQSSELDEDPEGNLSSNVLASKCTVAGPMGWNADYLIWG